MHYNHRLRFQRSSYAQLNPWGNPVRYQENKEAPHVAFMLLDKSKDVLADEYTRTSEYKSVNRQCKFSCLDKVANKDSYKNNLEDSDWVNITVTSNWKSQRFSIPIYTNIIYSFLKNTAFTGSNDSVGKI